VKTLKKIRSTDYENFDQVNFGQTTPCLVIKNSARKAMTGKRDFIFYCFLFLFSAGDFRRLDVDAVEGGDVRRLSSIGREFGPTVVQDGGLGPRAARHHRRRSHLRQPGSHSCSSGQFFSKQPDLI
jgi:hypothetical protein